MSATNRSTDRNPLDNYPTPQWTVDRLFEKLALPSGLWLEPCCGAGNLITRVNQLQVGITWHGIEIDPTLEESAKLALHSDKLLIKSFLDVTQEDINSLVNNKGHFDVIFTNPPFAISFEFLQKSLLLADHVVFLLRLNFLASKKRAAFMQECPPDVYVLPTRPSFKKTAKSTTDATEYAWLHWPPNRNRSEGKLIILNTGK